MTGPNEGFGTLTIRVMTTGDPLDLEPYTLHVAPLGRTEEMAPTDTLQLPDLEPGVYTANLGVGPNCLIPDGAVQQGRVEAGGEALINFQVDCGSAWWTLLTPPTGALMQPVFRDASRGFIAGRTELGGGSTAPELEFFVTENGGDSWSRRSALATEGDIGTFLYIVDDDVALTGGQGLTLLRTVDSGRSWIAHRLGEDPRFLLTAFFVDAQHGWVGGGGGNLFRTRNGGQGWQQVEIPFGQPIFGIHFADTLTGVVVGSREGGVNHAFHTKDGGQTWTLIPTDVPLHLQKLAFFDDTVGVAVGDQGAIVRTTDGGRSWTAVASPGFEVLWAVDFGTDGFGVAVGENGTILVSDDLGESWRREAGAPPGCCARVSVVDASHAWVAGRGMLLRRRIIE